MEIRPVGYELFHADGQTDQTNLIVAFHNFANSLNNDITTADFVSKQTGKLAVGYKRDLIDKLRGL